MGLGAWLAGAPTLLYIKGELANPLIDRLCFFLASKILFFCAQNRDDKYPLLLVNGIILSNAVLQIMDEKGFKDIKTFLAEADSRYKAVDKMPEDILFD